MPPRLRNPDEAGERGRAAERQARQFLEARGLKVLAKNYRTRWGELDIVMEHAGQIVFVEVRARRSSYFGGAAASVTAPKQARLIRAASRFLAESRLAHRPVRFDIVAVDGGSRAGAESQVEWITDAFRPSE